MRAGAVVLALLLGVLAGCGGDSSESGPCDSLDRLAESASALTALPPDAAMAAQYEGAVAEIETDYASVQSDSDDDLAGLESAWDSFQQAADGLEGTPTQVELEAVSEAAGSLVSATQAELSDLDCS